jgi:aminoglycoside phosphotransferase (APT) family kinase protein
MAARYADRTGRDLGALAFYEVLALFKLAVILEGTHAREAAAGVPATDQSMVDIVPRLLRGAAEFARGERR